MVSSIMVGLLCRREGGFLPSLHRSALFAKCLTYVEADPHDEAVNDGHADTAPVGSYPTGASPFGALDMAGNVWEWVADWYALYAARADIVFDPFVSEGSEIKVLRGGSYDFVAAGLRTTYRYEDGATHRQDSFGFRCAADK